MNRSSAPALRAFFMLPSLTRTQADGHAQCISLNNELQEAGLSLSSTAFTMTDFLPPLQLLSHRQPVYQSII